MNKSENLESQIANLENRGDLLGFFGGDWSRMSAQTSRWGGSCLLTFFQINRAAMFYETKHSTG